MLRRLLLALAGLIVLAVAVVLIFGPAYVERNLNPLNTPAEGWPVSEDARALHDRLVIGDWHSDALLWDRDLLERVDRGHTDIPRLREGNVAVQVFTTVTKSPSGLNYGENSAESADNITRLVIGQLRPIRTWSSLRERALDQAARLHHMAERAPDELVVIRSRADLSAHLERRAGGAETVGAILGTEGAHPLEGDIANVAALYDAGFRMMGLTHFFDNELGGSLHGQSGEGLSDFGREVVAEMVARNMVIDLAHASPAMVRDVLAMDGTVPIVSHTGIRSHCETPRNVPDELLQEITAKGGVIGIGFWSDVTCGSTPSDVARSIRAAIALLGEDHVSLGSDYDGSVDAPFDAAGLPALTQALLDEGVSTAQIEKVMGGNMMRFLSERLPES
ncbi:Zn-dependent dipeptidase, dipeptidase homolog [Paracoccus isoporae]|uniref:Zn-dependent dipeptidase, dipeptidase homolog n=1 Tax=Paracoccus isoporae TaxID=591205 RepID=A0A1G7AMQ3_9RHOB|nr:dipeptidase [Paracoccus isoporae]SDE15747.1 Zn-dependent dipeptidase, dipeptidase homolog [Paracoccus isoporae]